MTASVDQHRLEVTTCGGPVPSTPWLERAADACRAQLAGTGAVVLVLHETVDPQTTALHVYALQRAYRQAALEAARARGVSAPTIMERADALLAEGLGRDGRS